MVLAGRQILFDDRANEIYRSGLGGGHRFF
jgi:hypothetical protein